MNIGATLRKIRKSKNITLVELAKSADIDQATLSRIETGKMIGTLESHIKLCETLGISLSDLYRNVDKACTDCEEIATPKDDIDVSRDTGSAIRPLIKNAMKKSMFPYLLTIDPSGEYTEKKSDQKCEKFIYVVEGTLQLNINEENYSVGKNEGLYVNNSFDIIVKNTKTTQAKCLFIVSPPVL